MSAILLFVSALLISQEAPQQAKISASIEIPEALIPAVTPYLDCLDEAQVRLSTSAGPVRAVAMRQIVDQARGECARTRAGALERAAQLIAGEKPATERDRKKAAKVLARIDRSDESFLTELERLERNGGFEKK